MSMKLPTLLIFLEMQLNHAKLSFYSYPVLYIEMYITKQEKNYYSIPNNYRNMEHFYKTR